MSERPRWLLEFKKQVRELRKKSNECWYKSLQDNLLQLKETGRGNCVAWSLLLLEITLRYKLTSYLIILSSTKDRARHQVSVVVESDGSTYLQSCISITRQEVKIIQPLNKQELLEKLTTCARGAGWHKDSISIDTLEKFKNGKKIVLLYG